jgi:hypothetical protein
LGSIACGLRNLLYIKYRVILASTIGSKGLCPCPRCLIPLVRFQNLGMIRDMKQRETLARIDDDIKRHKVDVARQIIYQKKYAVDSKHVKTLLKEQSLAPTAVSTSLVICYRRLTIVCRTHFRRSFPTLVSIYSLCLLLISCTNSS